LRAISSSDIAEGTGPAGGTPTVLRILALDACFGAALGASFFAAPLVRFVALFFGVMCFPKTKRRPAVPAARGRTGRLCQSNLVVQKKGLRAKNQPKTSSSAQTALSSCSCSLSGCDTRCQPGEHVGIVPRRQTCRSSRRIPVCRFLQVACRREYARSGEIARRIRSCGARFAECH